MDLSTNSVQDINITVMPAPDVTIAVPAVVSIDMPITGVGGLKGDPGYTPVKGVDYFDGSIGQTGPANSLSIGSVTSSATPSATITGTAPSQTLNLVLSKGDTGAAGPANSLSIGTVSQGTAAATITGTAPSQTLNLTLPKGDTGSAATIAVGTVTTGAAGSSATITNAGSSSAAVFNFTIPKGDTGASGSGTGDMLSTNNLSDLTNTTTARTNLGLGSLATQNGTFSGTSSGTNTGDQTIILTGDTTGSGTGSFATTNTKMNGVAYSSLATGILKNTTGTGVPSIAVAADFPTLNQNTTGTASNVTGTVAITHGGTGVATLPTGILKGAGTGAITAVTAPTGAIVGTTDTQTLSGKTFSSQVISTVATGTAPLAVTSTTNVTNLNADTVDGIHANATATVGQLYPLVAKTTDTNGWTVYDYGLWKEYRKRVTCSGSNTSNTPTGLPLSSNNLPTGMTTLSTNFFNWTFVASAGNGWAYTVVPEMTSASTGLGGSYYTSQTNINGFVDCIIHT